VNNSSFGNRLSKVKDILNSVAVTAQEWQTLPQEVQDRFSREDLLNRVIPLIRHENTPVCQNNSAFSKLTS